MLLTQFSLFQDHNLSLPPDHRALIGFIRTIHCLSPIDRISCPLLTVQSFTSLIVPTKCWIRQEEDSHVSPGPPFRQRNPVPAVSRLSASRVLSDVPVDPVWQEPFTGSKTSPRTQKRGIRQRMP